VSTILKALRRLEQEKVRGAVRPLREQIAVPMEPHRRWLPWVLAGGTLSLGLALGATVMPTWPGGSVLSIPSRSSEVAAAESVAQVPEPAVAQTPEPAPVATRVEVYSVPPPAAEPRPATESERDALLDVAAFKASHTGPVARQAPRVRVPQVSVMQTVWHPQTSQRTAQVEVENFDEPLSLREGDAVGSLVVKRIEPSAVVFLHGSVEIRQRVGR
jgi:hypothetical protein